MEGALSSKMLSADIMHIGNKAPAMKQRRMMGSLVYHLGSHHTNTTRCDISPQKCRCAQIRTHASRGEQDSDMLSSSARLLVEDQAVSINASNSLQRGCKH